MMDKLFGFHLFEANVTFQELTKCRPQITNLQKPKGEKAEALNYMKKIEKKVKFENTNDNIHLSAAERRKKDMEIKPKINLALKLEVAKQPLKDRPYVQEVAEVFEEVL